MNVDAILCTRNQLKSLVIWVIRCLLGSKVDRGTLSAEMNKLKVFLAVALGAFTVFVPPMCMSPMNIWIMSAGERIPAPPPKVTFSHAHSRGTRIPCSWRECTNMEAFLKGQFRSKAQSSEKAPSSKGGQKAERKATPWVEK